MTKSTRPRRPRKPYPTFPLFPHRNGLWCKKIKGRFVYFGPWSDPDGALKRYQTEAADLHNGKTPADRLERLTVRDLCNKFLTSKKRLHDNEEITHRTFMDNYATCEVLYQLLGRDKIVDELTAGDFERLRAKMADRWGPVRLGNTIQRIRSVFKYAFDAGLVEKPIRYGPGFNRPSKKTLRINRAKNGLRMFEAAEIRALLDAAGQSVRAMILLGINAGLGNTDCSQLPLDALDLDRGWVNYPRPKTGVHRRCALWPETVSALREVLASRPKAKDADDARLLFLTRFGRAWIKITADRVEPNGDGIHKALHVVCDDAVTKEFAKLTVGLGIHRPRLGFYALRHTFETIGGEARDQAAVDHIMGHSRDDMASVYRERISDERLRAVAEHVRQWLFAEQTTPVQ
jgi:integrase